MVLHEGLLQSRLASTANLQEVLPLRQEIKTGNHE